MNTTIQLFCFLFYLLSVIVEAQQPTSTSAKGLEVSPAQGPFNWALVKNAGYSFVYYGATQGLRSVKK